ncbi:MAG: cell wall hydrolase [Rudaea sp.]|uniref:cell wall hydrolase n=1 Tax=Rudaea sp. TaxID=2136325 RepID=UPI0039E5757F
MKLSFLLWLASILPQPVADRACLAGTIYLEARSESTAGQLAVAEVALRRADSGQWGNSLCAVLTAPAQFAFTLVPQNYAMDETDALERSWAIANLAMANWSLPEALRYSVVPKADHFYASNTPTPAWAKGNPLARIGEHSFYRAD